MNLHGRERQRERRGIVIRKRLPSNYFPPSYPILFSLVFGSPVWLFSFMVCFPVLFVSFFFSHFFPRFLFKAVFHVFSLAKKMGMREIVH